MNIHAFFSSIHSLSRARKISFLFLGTLLVLGTSMLLIWQFSPHYSILFNHLDEEDMKRLLWQLESKKIPYRVDQNENTIFVERSRVNTTRIALMGEPFQPHSTLGFEVFDRSDFGMSDFSQQINYQRALQGELERTIAALDEIQVARVHLVLPQQHWFESSTAPSAAVTLLLKPHRILRPRSINGIQRLIAASVPRLTPERIVIVDGQGNSLSATDESDLDARLQAKQNMEHYLEQKAQGMLAAIFPAESVQVRIDVSLNYDTSDTRSENYLPEKQGIVTHSREERHLKENAKHRAENNSSSEKFYQYGKVIEKQHHNSGAITHLSVSVVVPQNTSLEKLQQIQKIVKSAIGFSPLRGDSISAEALVQNVEHLSSYLPAPVLPQANLGTRRYYPWAYLFAFGMILLFLTLHSFRVQKQRNRLLVELKSLLEHA